MKLVGQAGEFLVCSELARRDLIATPFAGNVPLFDIVVTDGELRSLPLQVKTARGGDWQTRADLWLEVELDEVAGTQQVVGMKVLPHPDLIYVYVWLDKNDPHMRSNDRFFILHARDVQQVVHDDYVSYLQRKDGRRPRSPTSMMVALRREFMEPFEDRWDTIRQALVADQPAR